MKLVIVTVVEQFQKEVFKLFKDAQIEQFSGSEIDGYKNITPVLAALSWFVSERGSAESKMFFSFTSKDKIDTLFDLIKTFNKDMETNNPVRAIVLPIEKYI